MRCDGTGVGAGLGGAGLLKLLPEPLHEFKFSMTAAVAASATKARVRRNAVMGLLPTSTLATINPIVLLPTRNLTNSCTGGIVTVTAIALVGVLSSGVMQGVTVPQRVLGRC